MTLSGTIGSSQTKVSQKRQQRKCGDHRQDLFLKQITILWICSSMPKYHKMDNRLIVDAYGKLPVSRGVPGAEWCKWIGRSRGNYAARFR